MKRLFLSLIILIIAIGVCSEASSIKTTESVTTGFIKTAYAATKESADSKKNDNEKTELQIISEKLALQMVKGNFKDTYNKFDSVMKKTITVDKLKDAWNSTIQGMGKYIGVYSNTYSIIDGYQQVYIILQYEYNGIRISFAYNDKEQITGIYISYNPIEEDLVSNDLFEEEKIKINKGKYPLTGILTLPKNVKKPPVAILVPGSGSHDANETVGANKVFRELAWKLAEKGIATIRYNERLYQYPQLASEEEFTIQLDSLNDANDAISYALKSKKIDKSKIYVIGHSLGGMMAPKIAADNPDVAGIIILAGSPRRLEDIIRDQQEISIKNTPGITEVQIKINMTIVDNTIKKIKELKKPGTDLILGLPESYWYSLNQIDTESIAKELKIPMLIAQGTADFQVYADKDYVAWQKLLKNKKNVTFKLYDNLNHLFMKSVLNGAFDLNEYNTPGEIDKKVIKDIAEWIKNN